MKFAGKLIGALLGLWGASLGIRAVFSLLGRVDFGQTEILAPLLGACVGAVVAVATFRRDFFRTLEHELTHILFAMLSFARPRALSVANGQGEAHYDGKGNIFISLSPYFFPLAAAVCAALCLVVASPYQSVARVLTASLLGAHLVYAAWEMFQGQPDLHEHGTTFSLAVIGGLLFVAAAPMWLAALLGDGAYGAYFVSITDYATADVLRGAAQVPDLVREAGESVASLVRRVTAS